MNKRRLWLATAQLIMEAVFLLADLGIVAACVIIATFRGPLSPLATAGMALCAVSLGGMIERYRPIVRAAWRTRHDDPTQ